MENKEIKINIYDKLQRARVKLQELNLKKSGKNKFSGFSYYELSDFLPYINQIFGELGLCSMFSISSEKMATLTVINQENPAETLTFSSLTAEVELKGCTPIQGIGAVHTYMKRYLYMNALEIVENDMLDAQAGNIREDNLKVNIESIQTVNDLNKAYKWLVENPSKDTSWRLKLKEKADQLNVIFNTDSKMFEPDSIPQFERPQLNGAIAH